MYNPGDPPGLVAYLNPQVARHIKSPLRIHAHAIGTTAAGIVGEMKMKIRLLVGQHPIRLDNETIHQLSNQVADVEKTLIGRETESRREFNSSVDDQQLSLLGQEFDRVLGRIGKIEEIIVRGSKGLHASTANDQPLRLGIAEGDDLFLRGLGGKDGPVPEYCQILCPTRVRANATDGTVCSHLEDSVLFTVREIHLSGTISAKATGKFISLG